MIFTERRNVFIVLIGLAVLVVVIVIVGVVRLTGNDYAKTENIEGTPFTTPAATDTKPVTPPKEPDRQAAESLARFFVERIGSYSNQSQFQNLDDVKPLMTSRVQAWAEGLKQQDAAGGYRGITTKALALEVVTWNQKQSAVMRVSTQRQEERDGPLAGRASAGPGEAPRVYYQDAEINLIYQNDTWLVDGVYWKESRE